MRATISAPDSYRGDMSCLRPNRKEGFTAGQTVRNFPEGHDAYAVVKDGIVVGIIVDYFGNNGRGKKAASSYYNKEKLEGMAFAIYNYREDVMRGPFCIGGLDLLPDVGRGHVYVYLGKTLKPNVYLVGNDRYGVGVFSKKKRQYRSRMFSSMAIPAHYYDMPFGKMSKSEAMTEAERTWGYALLA